MWGLSWSMILMLKRRFLIGRKETNEHGFAGNITEFRRNLARSAVDRVGNGRRVDAGGNFPVSGLRKVVAAGVYIGRRCNDD